MRTIARTALRLSIAAGVLGGCVAVAAENPSYQVELVSEGFEHPWALTFLNEREALVTERPGRLSRVDVTTGERQTIEGIPEVAVVNQGGLLDVALHPDFEETRWVYLSYAGAGEGGYATHVGRGRLDGNYLEDFEVIHVATPFTGGGQHFGSRLVFDAEGYLFVTVGDRGDRDRSQQLGNHQGTTLRLHEDGRIPADNPFVDREDAKPAIYSYGHRNAQGMTLHPETGVLWQHEHGPRGGDEVNLPRAGENYGWPVTSYGREYSDGSPIGPDPHERDDMVAPVYHWHDSYAPSGMTFYTGDAFPEWRNDLFIGSLARRHLTRLSVDGEAITGEETLLADRRWRIRDVRTGPDGYLYLLVDSNDAPLVRLRPTE
ncbi:hypothetical protein CAI21_04905 [Alkalilimnicola ehrlichii]|uniref:Glucose/Sorbosone dehydrogenase domain-containing protein n=1 Tax=Alkalilimnicola ehrlichii TaxID=351052 RepID=A0A3E0WYB4_9GAMM|nr:PQQ-dependent sugar dehydrogenase [Alkalilimnicola ehrlichii]RFA30419.1 hypothetical protein CAI21_04905 [Alkalilimnicola ehrlichii]RFA37972.1 hypothetical protein CAL65_06280 [Alkalilimnicola ehrlichii]